MGATAERLTRIKLERTIEVLGGQSEVARALGVHRSRITRWLAGEEPDPHNRARLEALEFITARLLQTFPPDTARKWLTGFNAHLGDRQPLYMIAHNRIAEILAAIEQDELESYS
jgi:transcriptional regulator with XRE-family HTH domain